MKKLTSAEYSKYIKNFYIMDDLDYKTLQEPNKNHSLFLINQKERKTNEQ